MSSSMRARRMARNHKKLKQQPKLNLVALMDIFTILVLFLMVNNGDVEVLQPDKKVTLPESVSEQKPEIALTIKVSDLELIVQGRAIESIESALAQDGDSLASLREELAHQSARAPVVTEREKSSGRSVIIMGDQQMPYKLLKRIMTTCAEMDYRNISLAVNSKPLPPADGLQLAASGSRP